MAGSCDRPRVGARLPAARLRAGNGGKVNGQFLAK